MIQDDNETSFVVTIGGRPAYALIDDGDISIALKLLNDPLTFYPLHFSFLAKLF